jgi:hypothetical protein
VINEEDTPLTFSDEDFERRYSPEAEGPSASGAGHPFRPATQQSQRLAAPTGRSRNKFMRTLLRRRLASSGTP